ncbi:hypothetical protein EVAR_36693_1 [Eumeta japonica]|uniref:Uncharacterized protein n=1 Tax=Eumeta variegata TaxID=151549 RepID=A0A4C1XNP1_EUMVA|nr:hypothetical protein EVAR_36693_1 [Eumeta japonica]
MSVESEFKARAGLRLTSIDRKDDKIKSMSMLTELRTLTIWESHPQERASNITCRRAGAGRWFLNLPPQGSPLSVGGAQRLLRAFAGRLKVFLKSQKS